MELEVGDQCSTPNFSTNEFCDLEQVILCLWDSKSLSVNVHNSVRDPNEVVDDRVESFPLLISEQDGCLLLTYCNFTPNSLRLCVTE